MIVDILDVLDRLEQRGVSAETLETVELFDMRFYGLYPRGMVWTTDPLEVGVFDVVLYCKERSSTDPRGYVEVSFSGAFVKALIVPEDSSSRYGTLLDRSMMNEFFCARIGTWLPFVRYA